VDLSKVLAQLRMELENLDLAIASLERLASQKHRGHVEAAGEVKRRGRPPKHAGQGSDTGISIEKRSGGK
jgi:hypothetical protein